MTGTGTSSMLPDFRAAPARPGQGASNGAARKDDRASAAPESGKTASRYDQVASRQDAGRLPATADAQSARHASVSEPRSTAKGVAMAATDQVAEVDPAISLSFGGDDELVLFTLLPPGLEGMTPGEVIRGLVPKMAGAPLGSGALPGDSAPLLASRETFATLLQSGGDLADVRLSELFNTPVASRTSGALELSGLAQAVPAELRGAEAALARGYATSVQVPVGAAEWGERIMGKLSWLTAQNVSVAEIHITPPELGPLEVRVQVQNEQATVTVHATTPAVREQLEAQSLRLRDMLAEQGINLEGFDVTDSGAGGAESDSGEGGQHAGGESGVGQVLTQDTAGQPALDLSWNGQVDLYV